MFVGKRDKVILQGKDLGDLYSLEQGGKNAGAKKIMIKHAGVEKTGGLSNDELLNIMDVVRNGKIADDSFELRDDLIRYAYDLKKEGVNFRVVIDEFNDGKKIFDYYSDRNFIDYGTTQKRLTGNKTFQSAPMAKDSQGLAFSPYKDDAQRVAQTNDSIIPQHSAKDELEIKTYANPHVGAGLASGTLNAKDENGNFDAEKFAKGFIYGLFGSKVTAERGSKLEQAEAKQEVVKGEGWTMRDGKPKPQNTEFRFSKEVRGKAKINDNPIVADLDMLQKKHSNVLKTKGAVARLILAIKDDPTHFLDGSNPQNALLLKKLKDGKTGMIGVRREDTPENLIVHALKSSNKKEIERLVRRQMGRASLPTTLKNETGTGAKAHSSASDNIISQNSAKDELKSLSKEYDVEQFLKDREDILAKDARYGKTRFSEARVEDNGGVGGWEYKRTPAGYDKNYNADFLITKADVTKIRGGKIDEQTLGKLKQDLESSEYLGYEYKKTHKNNGADEYADEEFFKGAPAEAKGGHSAAAAIEEQRFAGTGRDKNTIMYANPHVGAGLAGGTLNAKDENGNFDAEKFAKGFIYGLFGSKVTAATLKKTNPKLYDQIVKIGEGNANKEKISSFVNKLKQDELGKLLQKTVTNKDLSTKTKIEIIEAAKKRFTKETPKSLSGQSEAQMSENALKAKENNLKIDDVSNDAKEKWIKTFGLKSIDDDFIPNLKPEVKKAIKDKEIRLTKGSLLKIVARGREKYIPLIRQSLEDTDMVLKDEGTFLFVKEMDDKSLVFTSVGRNFDTHITIISNAPKKINNIKNKLMNKAEVVYRSSKLRTTPL